MKGASTHVAGNSFAYGRLSPVDPYASRVTEGKVLASLASLCMHVRMCAYVSFRNKDKYEINPMFRAACSRGRGNKVARTGDRETAKASPRTSAEFQNLGVGGGGSCWRRWGGICSVPLSRVLRAPPPLGPAAGRLGAQSLLPLRGV